MALLGVGYAAYCLVGVASLRVTEIEIDSPKYLSGTIFDPRFPGILTTAVYSVITTDAIVLVQMAVAVAAWMLLAVGVHRYVGGSAGVSLAAVVLAYSLATPAISWQWLAMTDGLALSSLVAAIGCLLLAVASPHSNVTTAVLLLAPSAFVALARPTLLVAVLPPTVAVILWQRPDTVRRTVRSCLAAVVVVAAWGIWRLWALSRLEWERVWYAQNNLAMKEDFYERARPFMGECRPLTRTLAHIRDQTPGVIPPVLRPDQCPKAYAWLSSGASSPWSWFVHRPVEALHDGAYALAFTRLPVYATQDGVVPSGWSDMLLPATLPVARIALLYLVVGVLLLGISSRRMRWSWRRAGLVAIAAAGAGAYLFVSWASDGIETARHMMPVTTLVPLVMLLVPMLLLDARVSRTPTCAPVRYTPDDRAASAGDTEGAGAGSRAAGGVSDRDQ